MFKNKLQEAEGPNTIILRIGMAAVTQLFIIKFAENLNPNEEQGLGDIHDRFEEINE